MATRNYELDLSTANWHCWRGQSKLYAEDETALVSWIAELSEANIAGYTINIVDENGNHIDLDVFAMKG